MCWSRRRHGVQHQRESGKETRGMEKSNGRPGDPFTGRDRRLKMFKYLMEKCCVTEKKNEREAQEKGVQDSGNKTSTN